MLRTSKTNECTRIKHHSFIAKGHRVLITKCCWCLWVSLNIEIIFSSLSSHKTSRVISPAMFLDLGFTSMHLQIREGFDCVWMSHSGHAGLKAIKCISGKTASICPQRNKIKPLRGFSTNLLFKAPQIFIYTSHFKVLKFIGCRAEIACPLSHKNSELSGFYMPNKNI